MVCSVRYGLYVESEFVCDVGCQLFSCCSYEVAVSGGYSVVCEFVECR